MVIDTRLKEIEDIIKYKFKDKSYINTAFVHSSYANEKKDKKVVSYERLEFLGDAIVDMIVGEHLYLNYPKLSEGELTRIRAIVVCEPTFYKCIKRLNLGRFLLLGKGEELSGGRERISILADIFETISGAIYLDGGYEEAKEFVIRELTEIIAAAIDGEVFMDYKTQLQEVLQKSHDCKIEYVTVDEYGPDHDKTFMVQVKNNNKTLGEGKGKSKKEAEQTAAKQALEKLES